MNLPLIRTLTTICILWLAVLVGYYILLPQLRLSIGYNSNPFLVADYYAACSLLTILAFDDVFWARLPERRQFLSDMGLVALFAAVATMFLWALSYLAAPHIPLLEPATDLLLATPWYFLPKSIEIFLQQLLIAAFVFELDRQKYTLRTTVLTYALAFGSAHLLLIFGGSFPPTVLIMTLAAVISATIFPYLLLRARRGFLYSYMIHWTFYAFLVLILRFAS